MTVIIASGALGTTGANLLYRNLLLEGTLTATSEAADGLVENAVSGETWDYWKQTVTASNMAVDLGSAKTCDGCGISAHTIGTSGAMVNVQYSSDNATWFTAATSSPTNNDTLFFVFPPLSYRYWRIQIIGAICSLGVVILGQRLQFSSGVLTGHTSMHNAKKSKLLSTNTISGQHRNNRITRMGIEGKIDFGLVATSFGDGAFQEFKDHYNAGKIFFYAGSPLNYPKDTALCWRPESAGDISPSYQEGGALMDLSMEVSAFVDT
jgi:F5/8 type C domain